ncbi:MAG: hypothetical protein SCARUB_02992 [Candidatus Scalindua rubra]|uniref:Uncharacterized protein n=1 Tax=Candidatus Scalindua rubra TaxID=1872076 RepID=A0A1E3X8C6_9BACT|nr:MAG: hypothetical protein SCARUB_02992 [Candidatus Scalindua rubra]
MSNKDETYKNAITVKIYRDDDLFFAENETLVVCGTGDIPQDALQDLCFRIIHFFEYYKKFDESELTGDALRLKNSIKIYLLRNNMQIKRRTIESNLPYKRLFHLVGGMVP